MKKVKKSQKEVFTISEFAKLGKVNIQTVRYYEREKLLSPSFRKNNGYRVYSVADRAPRACPWVNEIGGGQLADHVILGHGISKDSA